MSAVKLPIEQTLCMETELMTKGKQATKLEKHFIWGDTDGWSPSKPLDGSKVSFPYDHVRYGIENDVFL